MNIATIELYVAGVEAVAAFACIGGALIYRARSFAHLTLRDDAMAELKVEHEECARLRELSRRHEEAIDRWKSNFYACDRERLKLIRAEDARKQALKDRGARGRETQARKRAEAAEPTIAKLKRKSTGLGSAQTH